MAISGLDIYKKLPKTNCGDCGVPTCMAFAMKVASGQVAVTVCPHIDKKVVDELGKTQAEAIQFLQVLFKDLVDKKTGAVSGRALIHEATSRNNEEIVSGAAWTNKQGQTKADFEIEKFEDLHKVIKLVD